MSENQYCLITGATSGIGKETAKALLHEGFNLIILTRDLKRGSNLKQELEKLVTDPHQTIDIFQADFISLEEVRSACNEIKAKYPYLNILINNAGIFAPRRKITKDNLESTMEVNHFSHFLLTLELLPLLTKVQGTRIINVASVGHYQVKDIPLDDLTFKKHYSGFFAYRISKLANVLFTYSLSEKLKAKGSSINVNALHPGVVRTSIARKFPIIGWMWRINPQYISAEKGAQTTIYLATSKELAQTTGKYFSKAKEKKSSELSYDKNLQEKFWNLSLQITGTHWE